MKVRVRGEVRAVERYACQVRIPVGQECRAGTAGVGSSSVMSRNEPRLISPTESLTACRGSQKAETGRRAAAVSEPLVTAAEFFAFTGRPSTLPLTQTHALSHPRAFVSYHPYCCEYRRVDGGTEFST